MKIEELFKEDYVELFMPDGVEYISTILENLGYTYKNENSSLAKENGMQVIEELFRLDLIEVFHWGKSHEKLKDLIFTESETISQINHLWYKGAQGPDFYSMPMFKYKNWYLKALEREGLTNTTYWRTFVNEKIGDLETWIKVQKQKQSK